jgi:DNA-directed RNA polymerase subunit omega
VAQEGYDTLIALTDSRYRLSMIVARRAAQLKSGIPSVLDVTELPRTENSVTIAMKELESTDSIKWGDELPSSEELKRVAEPPKPEPAAVFTPAPFDEDDA